MYLNAYLHVYTFTLWVDRLAAWPIIRSDIQQMFWSNLLVKEITYEVAESGNTHVKYFKSVCEHSAWVNALTNIHSLAHTDGYFGCMYFCVCVCLCAQNSPSTEWWAVRDHVDSQRTVLSHDLHCSRQATIKHTHTHK